MFRFNFETAASSEAKPNGFAASINKTIYNLKVQRTIKLKTENFNRKNVRFISFERGRNTQTHSIGKMRVCYQGGKFLFIFASSTADSEEKCRAYLPLASIGEKEFPKGCSKTARLIEI